MSAVLPEFQILGTLKAGFAALRDDTTLVDDLFVKYGTEAVKMIKTYLTEHEVTVVPNWPRPDMAFPILAVLSTGESESAREDPLGDQLESELDETETEVTQHLGLALRANINVLVLTGDANLTMYLYQIARNIIHVNKLNLHTGGLIDMTIAGGDFRMDPNYFPEFAYARSLNLAFLHYFTTKDIPERVVKKFKVQFTFSGHTQAGPIGNKS